MRKVLATLAVLFFVAEWNTHVQNSNGRDLLMIFGPFPTVEECGSTVQGLHLPSTWTFDGCLEVRP